MGKIKETEKKVRAMPVNMRCSRCRHVTFIVLPVGNPMCPHCGRPWFWPFVPIYKENEAWAREYVAKVESTFKTISEPVTVRKLFEDTATIGEAYKEFVGVMDQRRTL